MGFKKPIADDIIQYLFEYKFSFGNQKPTIKTFELNDRYVNG